MAEFTPIQTQEELDRIIKDRLTRNTQAVTEQVTEQFEGYISPEKYRELQDSVSEKDSEIEKLKAENSKYVTSTVKMRIAKEVGLPLELASRITGDDEKAMKADAQSLIKLFTPAAPMASTENKDVGKNTAYQRLLDSLKE